MNSEQSLPQPALSLGHCSRPPEDITAIPDVLLETGNQFEFRAYLGSKPPHDDPAAIIDEELDHVLGVQGDLSNEQLYDELYGRLCGPEPLEQEPLLNFMKLCLQVFAGRIASSAAEALPMPTASAASDETFPVSQPVSFALAKLFPQQTLARLRAIQHVAAAHAKSGLIYQLAEFIGCTDLEISQLLDTTPEKVASRRLSVKIEVGKLLDHQTQS